MRHSKPHPPPSARSAHIVNLEKDLNRALLNRALRRPDARDHNSSKDVGSSSNQSAMSRFAGIQRYHGIAEQEELPGTVLLQNLLLQRYGGLEEDCRSCLFLRVPVPQAKLPSSVGSYFDVCQKKRLPPEPAIVRQLGTIPGRYDCDQLDCSGIQLPTLAHIITLVPILQLNKECLEQIELRSCHLSNLSPLLEALKGTQHLRLLDLSCNFSLERLTEVERQELFDFICQHSTIRRVGLQKCCLPTEFVTNVHRLLLERKNGRQVIAKASSFRRKPELSSPVDVASTSIERTIPPLGDIRASVQVTHDHAMERIPKVPLGRRLSTSTYATQQHLSIVSEIPTPPSRHRPNRKGPLTRADFEATVRNFDSLCSPASGCIDVKTFREAMPVAYQRFKRLLKGRDTEPTAVNLFLFFLATDHTNQLSRSELLECIERFSPYAPVIPQARPRNRLREDLRVPLVSMFTALDADGDGLISIQDLHQTCPESAWPLLDAVMDSLGVGPTSGEGETNKGKGDDPSLTLESNQSQPDGPAIHPSKKVGLDKKTFAHQVAVPYLMNLRRSA